MRQDIPSGSLAVNDMKMRLLPGWVEKHRPDTDAAKAARGEFGTKQGEDLAPVDTNGIDPGEDAN